MPELNSSRNTALRDFFTEDFASWTVHFVNICVRNQQMQQLFIHFINYVWYLLHVSALHCHHQRAFLVPSERCSIKEQSIEYCVWACVCLAGWCVHHAIRHTHAHPQYSIVCSLIEHLSEGIKNATWGWQYNAETCRIYKVPYTINKLNE
jgi:hypothetical protein